LVITRIKAVALLIDFISDKLDVNYLYNVIMKKIYIALLFCLMLGACSTIPAQSTIIAPVVSATPTVTFEAVPLPSSCSLAPIVVPTLPAVIPGFNELDKTTNLHVTGGYRVINVVDYRLKITGLVDHPISLTYDNLRCMTKISASPLLVCPGVFEDQATWSGVPIKDVLSLAGVQVNAKNLLLISADGYKYPISISEALAGNNFLAYEVNGQTLPILHGFPLRAVFPNKYGSSWIKWLIEINVQ